MTDIQKAYSETIPIYRTLSLNDKEAFKTLADLFLFLYKNQTDSKNKETKSA